MQRFANKRKGSDHDRACVSELPRQFAMVTAFDVIEHEDDPPFHKQGLDSVSPDKYLLTSSRKFNFPKFTLKISISTSRVPSTFRLSVRGGFLTIEHL